MKRNVFTLFALLALIAVGGTAQSAPAPGWYPSQQRDPAADAAAVVKQGMEGLLAFMNAKPRPTGLKLAAYVEDKVVPSFDFQLMARMSLGPAYQQLDKEKAADLEQQIEQHFLKALIKKMVGFDQQRVRFFRPRRAGFNRAVVTVGIANPGGYPSRFDFRMHQGKDGWKVYDVSANGHSVVSFYRRHFMQKMMAGEQGRGF
jgi:ABC-type transporter MlaC component